MGVRKEDGNSTYNSGICKLTCSMEQELYVLSAYNVSDICLNSFNRLAHSILQKL